MERQIIEKLMSYKQMKPKSAKKYAGDIKRLHQRIYNKPMTDLQWLTNRDNVLKGAKMKTETEEYNYLTFRNNLNSVIMVLRSLGNDTEADTYVELRDKFNDKYTEDNATGKYLNQKQMDKHLSFKEWDDIIKQLESKQTLSQMEQNFLIVMKIHREYPLRNDLGDMEIITKSKYDKLSDVEKDERNRFIKNQRGMTLVLAQYKTEGKYHRKEIKITNVKIKKFLTKLLKNNPDRKFVLQKDRGKPLTNEGLAVTMNVVSKQFNDGVSFGTTALRKSYMTNRFSKTKREMKKMANVLGHSVNTGMSIYTKENKEVI